MLNWSLIDPPGWITAVIPALSAISTQSGNGKNASLAITAPSRLKLKDCAFSIACRNASTRLVWPVPLAQSCFPFAKTIVFDFVCLQIFEANNKSSNSWELGLLFVACVKISALSVILSLSWTKTPFKQVLTVVEGSSISFCTNKILFFFPSKISCAFAEKEGAMTTSQKRSWISCAVASSISTLLIKIPPKAETGSPAKAAI